MQHGGVGVNILVTGKGRALLLLINAKFDSSPIERWPFCSQGKKMLVAVPSRPKVGFWSGCWGRFWLENTWYIYCKGLLFGLACCG